MGLIKNPYPVVTKKVVHDLHNLCIKSFTNRTMLDEAKQIERDKLRKKAKKAEKGKSDKPDDPPLKT